MNQEDIRRYQAAGGSTFTTSESTSSTSKSSSSQSKNEWSAVVAQIMVEIGEKAVGAMAGKFFENALENYGFGASAELKRAEAGLNRAKEQLVAEQAKHAQFLREHEENAQKGENDFNSCMMQYNDDNKNKIPTQCKEAAIFFAKFGGQRAKFLLDMDFK